ncbi:hypothetical protein BDY17DRAFT_95911 [Neohortaea acidophila]|uniref:Ankyrin repeat-containing domain protein n=1 Tax=Neohortaea acidophila TaxID=245834 RepID=A0A6A6Q0W7_9PEZI|nr:uncharacterized protein BDY17DRAFT_95911 [Neohortaea acidophila]KAF2485057.1 hypothetical protein BDY17DRAFT_95911 [Neohortaea acidophila]
MSRPNYDEEPYLSIRKACETDDVDLLSRVITPEMVAMKPMPDRTFTLLDFACDTSIRHNATSVLSYVVSDCKFNVQSLDTGNIAGISNVSTGILDILLAHGWDINGYDLSSPRKQLPFLWRVLSKDYLVSYCLSHGADVYPRGQPPIDPNFITVELRNCPPLLERAAAYSTVATFDLLRSHGAPMGWRALHLAVQEATHPWLTGRPDSTRELMSDREHDKAYTYAERMAMVRHLVEDVGLDVNALDQPVTQKHVPTFHRGTPLCYVSDSEVIEGLYRGHTVIADTRELTWYLLDQGADPTQALEVIKHSQHPTFAADVEMWRAQRKLAASKHSRCMIQ